MESQSFLPQKSKEEGPKISQIRGHIHPHSIKWVCDFNQCRIQSPSSDRATTSGRVQGSRPSGQSYPSLDTRAEILTSHLAGNGAAGWVHLFSHRPTPPTLAGISMPTPGPSEYSHPLGMPGSHLPLCPTCLGSRPWGLLLCSPQARKSHSAHWCLLLTRPCVI